jgi:hypothetical protein
MNYGELPKSLGLYDVKVQEMFFYQYLPIKLKGDIHPIYEERLKIFDLIIGTIGCHFIGKFGLNRYKESYMYITAKNLYQRPNCEFNRLGWHSDGFLSDDINYIWCNNTPTMFCEQEFVLTPDHDLSLLQMDMQARNGKISQAKDNELLMLNQYVIHKVATAKKEGMRAFLKVSFSHDKYNLIGNSYNSLLSYDWDMKPRKVERNTPASL